MRQRDSVLPIALITLLITLLLSSSGSSAADIASQSDLKIENALLNLVKLDGQMASLWAQERGIELGSRPDSFVAIIEPSPRASTYRLALALQANHAAVDAISRQFVKAEVPFEQAIEIAQLEEVGYIRRPLFHRPLDVTTSAVGNRGVLETGGSMMHAYKFRGDSVVIAVIDNGFEGLSDAIRRGELPAEAIMEAIDYQDVGIEESGSSHGLEVARIAHEMAPKAKLILMNVDDEVDLENAVDDAIGMGANVINHSIGWFNSNFGDGTGPIAEIVKKAREAGIIWVNAAGNQAASHWMGPNLDEDEDDWIEFAPETEAIEFTMQFPGQIDLAFVWNDFPQTREDYDLYLTDWTDTVIASSEERQTGFAPPSEQLQHFVERPGLYKIKIKAHDVSRPMELKLFAMEQILTPSVSAGSVVSPADCECALAVGAISIYKWQLGHIEFFSAQGPTTDGRIKPDLVAPDGMRGLNGTSFSAPHVAGAAALLLSQNPGLNVNELMKLLTAQTLDIYAPGKDNITGYGKLEMRLSAPKATRELSAQQLRPGDELIVSVSARMPALQFGRIELAEKIPAGFDVDILDDNGGAVVIEPLADTQIIRWVRELVGPGDRVELRYSLAVTSEIESGAYEIAGQLNRQAVDGPTQFEVVSTRSANVRHEALVAPVVTSQWVRFVISPRVQQRASSTRVQVLDLNGELVSDSGWRGPQRVAAFVSREWSSGVYLYLFTARDAGGRIIDQSLKKFHVLVEAAND